MKRRICVVTGSRAEYGLLRPLMEEIQRDSSLILQLIATGMHLSAEFGLTYKEIERDGFRITKKIEILSASHATIGISKSMGLALTGFVAAYESLKPDIIVVVGDRFEIFSAVIAALIGKRCVAHLYGGERTEGAFDDAMRHCITKMSHLHFTSTEKYRKRVIQLGEKPSRVFNVGAIGLDNIRKMPLLDRKALEKELGFKFGRHNFLVTFHPVTLEGESSGGYFKNLLDAFSELEDTNIIFTKANVDPGGAILNKMIDDYVKKRPGTTKVFAAMGQFRYLSTMRFVDAVVGNSSSGIIEAPSFKIGTINIGDRQLGRIQAKSIINCKPTKGAIRNAIKRLYSKTFQEGLKGVVSPYGDGKTAKRIYGILKRQRLENIIKKNFYDVDFK